MPQVILDVIDDDGSAVRLVETLPSHRDAVLRAEDLSVRMTGLGVSHKIICQDNVRRPIPYRDVAGRLVGEAETDPESLSSYIALCENDRIEKEQEDYNKSVTE